METKKRIHTRLEISFGLIDKYIIDITEKNLLKEKYAKIYFVSLINDHCNTFFPTRKEGTVTTGKIPYKFEEILECIDEFIKDDENSFLDSKKDKFRKELVDHYVRIMCNNIASDAFANEYFELENIKK